MRSHALSRFGPAPSSPASRTSRTPAPPPPPLGAGRVRGGARARRPSRRVGAEVHAARGRPRLRCRPVVVAAARTRAARPVAAAERRTRCWRGWRRHPRRLSSPTRGRCCCAASVAARPAPRCGRRAVAHWRVVCGRSWHRRRRARKRRGGRRARTRRGGGGGEGGTGCNGGSVTASCETDLSREICARRFDLSWEICAGRWRAWEARESPTGSGCRVRQGEGEGEARARITLGLTFR